MREKPRDKARLQHILQAIDNINKFKEGVDYNEFESNKILFYAIVKNVEMVGEAAYMLSKDFKSSHPEQPWIDIEGMRHVLVHDYYNISVFRVWDTINSDMISLRQSVVQYLQELPDEDINGNII